MYPRNAASPPRIAIGPVVQISDGAVQTSGCTVRLLEEGGTEGDGAGTTAYSTDGVVLYTPTQAETDQSAFVLIAKKTGCIPASVTVVTTASATAGKVVLSGETHTSAVIPTVTTLTGHTAQTGDCYARLGAPAGASVSADVAAVKSDTAAVLLDTGTDGVVVAAASKAGYALSAAGVQAIWDALTSALTTVGSIGKRLSDYITGDAYARLGAPAGASVSADVAAINAKTTNLPAAPASTTNITAGTITTVTNLTNAPTNGDFTATMKSSITAAVPSAAATADAVWDEAIAGHAGAGSTGAALSAAGSAGDPWIAPLPGSYTAGQAGYIIGTYLDAKISSAGGGAGAITWTYTLTEAVGGAPIADADVWVTTDLAGTNVIASGQTNQYGVVTFYLDAGTVYVWRQKSGYNFSNPDTEAVS